MTTKSGREPLAFKSEKSHLEYLMGVYEGENPFDILVEVRNSIVERYNGLYK